MTTQSATIAPVALAGNGMRWLQIVIGGSKFAATNSGLLYTAKGTAALLVALWQPDPKGQRQLGPGLPDSRRRRYSGRHSCDRDSEAVAVAGCRPVEYSKLNEEGFLGTRNCVPREQCQLPVTLLRRVSRFVCRGKRVGASRD
jgi:hypothetical protein